MGLPLPDGKEDPYEFNRTRVLGWTRVGAGATIAASWGEEAGFLCSPLHLGSHLGLWWVPESDPSGPLHSDPISGLGVPGPTTTIPAVWQRAPRVRAESRDWIWNTVIVSLSFLPSVLLTQTQFGIWKLCGSSSEPRILLTIAALIRAALIMLAFPLHHYRPALSRGMGFYLVLPNFPQNCPSSLCSQRKWTQVRRYTWKVMGSRKGGTVATRKNRHPCSLLPIELDGFNWACPHSCSRTTEPHILTDHCEYSKHIPRAGSPVLPAALPNLWQATPSFCLYCLSGIPQI